MNQQLVDLIASPTAGLLNGLIGARAEVDDLLGATNGLSDLSTDAHERLELDQAANYLSAAMDNLTNAEAHLASALRLLQNIGGRARVVRQPGDGLEMEAS
jgi:hypothetical protein